MCVCRRDAELWERTQRRRTCDKMSSSEKLLALASLDGRAYTNDGIDAYMYFVVLVIFWCMYEYLTLSSQHAKISPAPPAMPPSVPPAAPAPLLEWWFHATQLTGARCLLLNFNLPTPPALSVPTGVPSSPLPFSIPSSRSSFTTSVTLTSSLIFSPPPPPPRPFYSSFFLTPPTLVSRLTRSPSPPYLPHSTISLSTTQASPRRLLVPRSSRGVHSHSPATPGNNIPSLQFFSFVLLQQELTSFFFPPSVGIFSVVFDGGGLY